MLTLASAEFIAGVVFTMLLTMSDDGSVQLPVYHCKRCHETIPLRKNKMPPQCGRCGKRRHQQFPRDFNPNTCSCRICLLIWEAAKSQPGGCEALLARERGRPLGSPNKSRIKSKARAGRR